MTIGASLSVVRRSAKKYVCRLHHQAAWTSNQLSTVMSCREDGSVLVGATMCAIEYIIVMQANSVSR